MNHNRGEQHLAIMENSKLMIKFLDNKRIHISTSLRGEEMPKSQTWKRRDSWKRAQKKQEWGGVGSKQDSCVLYISHKSDVLIAFLSICFFFIPGCSFIQLTIPDFG